MLSGGILSSKIQQRDKRDRNGLPVNSGAALRQPQYGRSGLLARAADEERVSAIVEQNKKKAIHRASAYGTGPTRDTIAPADLCKFIPSPFVLTPMLLTGGITSSTRRLISDEIGALRAQVRVLTADEGALSARSREDESTLEAARRELVERFVVSVPKENKSNGVDDTEEIAEIFDAQSAAGASEALNIFNELAQEEARRVSKRVDLLEHQLQRSKAEGGAALRKEAVALLPTSYLQGLLQYHHFLEQAGSEVARASAVCAEEAATAAARSSSILPLPAMAQRMLGHRAEAANGSAVTVPSADVDHRDTASRPVPKQVAHEAFCTFLTQSVRSISTEFTRVELPLGMTVADLDEAEAKRYPPTASGERTINARSHTTLTRSIQIVVLKEGHPIPGARPMPTLQLIGEKYYDGGVASSVTCVSGGDVTSNRNDDPLAAFGFHDKGVGSAKHAELHTRAKYRFHLLPFPNAASNANNEASAANASEITVDTIAIFGRSADHSTVVTEHPSCSGQHFAMFWTLAFTKVPDSLGDKQVRDARPTHLPLTVSETQWLLELQVADLGASNGTALLGGGADGALPKAPVGLAELPTSQLSSHMVTDVPLQQSETAKNTVVMRVACPMQREEGKGGEHTTGHAYVLPQDVGFGPIGSKSYTVCDGDQIVTGASTRRYVIVYDEEGVVSGPK